MKTYIILLLTVAAIAGTVVIVLQRDRQTKSQEPVHAQATDELISPMQATERPRIDEQSAQSAEPREAKAKTFPRRVTIPDQRPQTSRARNIQEVETQPVEHVAASQVPEQDKPLTDTPPQKRIKPLEIPNPSAVSDNVKLMIGFGEEKDYPTRYKAVHQLEKTLSRPDVEALYTFMNMRPDHQPNLKPLAVNALKNEILNNLISQESIPEDLSQQIVSMYENREMDVVWRDYSIQHILPYYEKEYELGSTIAESDTKRQAFTNALHQAVQATGSVLLNRY